MKESRLLKTLFSALLIILFTVLIRPGAARAAMSDYCQIPPYVFQSVLPSVTFLISNTTSMLNFAYGDNAAPTNLCTDNNLPCGGFNNNIRHYGFFDPDYWYVYKTSGGGRFEKQGSTRSGQQWSGNFLNWLTLRRIDVVRKIITGGEGQGYAACLLNNARYKKFPPANSANYTPFDNADNILVTFNQQNNCDGLSLSNFSFRVTDNGTTTNYSFDVKESSSGTRSGIYQEFAAKAQMEFTFFNADNEGGNIAPQIDGSPPPLSSMMNRINTPSNFNGIASAPLGEALWTIVGHYALSGSSSGAGYGTCANCGPRYHNGDYNPGKDPYTYHGSASRCVKGNVIVLSDGEPCSDGNLPGDILNFQETNGSFHTKCTSGGCDNAAALGVEYKSANPSCDASGSGFDRVALFAHTQDLRNSTTFANQNLANKQNLDLYVIRAFGSDNSNLLKYAAINGSFDDLNGNGIPDAGEFSLSRAYSQADDGYAIEAALREILGRLLRRATSGTAASVLASGEGSGANLVQAVFYPRRTFGNEIIEWTGTMQNLWYYIDPFFRDASIREDSDLDKILHIVDDKTAEYYYDSNAGVTKVNLFSNDASGKKNSTDNTVIAFENLKSIWEAGGLLHPRSAGNRRIFTVLDNTTSPRTQVPFHIDNASNLQTNLNASSVGEAQGIIEYVRGVDNTNLRPRTVAYPLSTSDNNVWKLGDIINSTPRIVTRIPLNAYDKVYGDTTYKAYIDNTDYKSRGMVFAGGNDGMLHALRLGTLEFSWGQTDKMEKARLTVGAGSLGSEAWGFIPKNALPYLKYLQDNNYCHLYYVDLPPQIFDASIGPPGSPADNGAVRDIYSWRSILIGGMRFGGACRDNTATCSTSTECVKSPVADSNGLSSYFAIDVTNPEDPKVLWEFSNQELGFATTGPAIVRINARGGSGAADRSRNGSWYVVVGSGPTGPISDRQFMGNSVQDLKLFVIDLKSGSLLRTIPTGITNAFAGSMINSTADLNLDYEDDVLYFGYVNKDTSAGTWTKGGVGRLITKGSALPADWVFSKVIDNIGPVTSSVVRLQNNTYNKNWLFFGSGRYYFEKPDPFNVSLSQGDDPSSQRYLYGLWDKCFMTNNMIDPVCNTRTYATLSGDSSLQNTDTTTITEAAANTGGIDGWKIPLDTTVSVDYDGLGALKYRTERMITDPLATTAGTVFFTTYRPYGDDCSIGGRTFLWAVRYNTGGLPKYALQGKALLQVSTASVEQLDLSTAFSGDSSLHRGGRRSFSLDGVPPTAQGLSIVSPPPPVKRILHMKER